MFEHCQWVLNRFVTNFNCLRSFSIQLKFPRRQKIPPDFRTEHAQSWHLKSHAEKDERKKKLRIFNFLGGFSRKKIINQSKLSKRKQIFWKMTVENMKTAFHLPNGVSKDFIWNFIWQPHQQQQHQKNINQEKK